MLYLRNLVSPPKPRLTCRISADENIVDLEAFPDYLDVIGGEDNMMDMGTMQAKVDRNEYRNIDQIEVSTLLCIAPSSSLWMTNK